MDWLKTLAPLLGTALGGPLGGAAAAFIGDKLGLHEKTIEAVTAALTSGTLSPDQLTNIKLAEIEFKKFLETNKIDVLKIEAADRDSARNMMSITKAKTPAVLTYILGLGFFIVLFALFLVPGVKDSPPLMIMLGVLGAEFSAACKFWYGTTNSSGDKNALLAAAGTSK
jgi:hypothetical protein